MLSYARPAHGVGTDLEPIKRVFDDLSEEIGYISPGLKSTAAAAFDQEMPLGVDWQKRLAYFLAHCRVLVPLVNPPFFESEWCGKEWWVFSRRKVVARPPLKSDERAVVPIIWVPMASAKMHSSVRELQYTNRRMPASYAREGLLALYRRGNKGDYRQAINHIASRVSELMEHTDIEIGKMVNLRTAPNAFKEQKGHPNWQNVRFWHEDDIPIGSAGM